MQVQSPVRRDCLNDAQFVAIDCEMTGLFGPDNINSWWDTAEDRYAAQASDFIGTRVVHMPFGHMPLPLLSRLRFCLSV